ncbi:ABC transporter substrate-binding protein [Pelagibius litoralis]|uniref:ABC transporter substrate-binding protein n=1 Tax=Pelagibius litoralis TaxID=374515 RepID=A0A967F3J2_9PROT|nr:ABC transporter substrate-binding protein [Pelagibius litoralis]NIA72220.1 ABC transporter substrate-binding protein [Pelagibius litoralis]
MKKLISAVFVAALAMGAVQADAKDWKKVRIGVEGAYPPFSEVTPDGKLIGFDIDIANALCDQMKVECELVTQDWDGIIPSLQARKYDAIIASMSITPERKEKVDFTNKYYQTPAKFVRKQGSGIEITKESLKGKAVGVQRATIHDNFVTEVYGEAVEVKRYGTQDEAYLDMVAGRIDLLLADSIALEDGFLKTDSGKDYEFVGPDFTDPKYFGDGAGIALRKNEDELREMFNAAIDAIRANGTYKSIQDKYFDFNVYGS